MVHSISQMEQHEPEGCAVPSGESFDVTPSNPCTSKLHYHLYHSTLCYSSWKIWLLSNTQQTVVCTFSSCGVQCVCVWCIIHAASPVAKLTTEAKSGCATSASKEMLWVMIRVPSSLPLNIFLILLLQSAVPSTLCCNLWDQPTRWAYPTVLHHWIPATGNATLTLFLLFLFFLTSSFLSILPPPSFPSPPPLSAFRCCSHHLSLCCGYLPGWGKPSSSQGILTVQDQ